MCTVGSHICQPRCQLPDAWVVSAYTSCWPWLCLVCPGCVIYHIAWATLSSSLLEPATAVLVVARAKKFIILLLPREGAGCWSSESSDCFSVSRSSIWWGGTTVNKSGTPERAQARPAVDPPEWALLVHLQNQEKPLLFCQVFLPNYIKEMHWMVLVLKQLLF